MLILDKQWSTVSGTVPLKKFMFVAGINSQKKLPSQPHRLEIRLLLPMIHDFLEYSGALCSSVGSIGVCCGLVRSLESSGVVMGR
jgi:hypothetical protein